MHNNNFRMRKAKITSLSKCSIVLKQVRRVKMGIKKYNSQTR